jgi:hypothetical protein
VIASLEALVVGRQGGGKPSAMNRIVPAHFLIPVTLFSHLELTPLTMDTYKSISLDTANDDEQLMAIAAKEACKPFFNVM